jgi:VIT1/CCC1 family predicted Fe2+/Mn2+ transporter
MIASDPRTTARRPSPSGRPDHLAVAGSVDSSVGLRGSGRAAALVRDVILGGQDGLVNVLGLVLGMAVATGDSRVVITAGLAAMLAESIAMAGVAYTSSGAERGLVTRVGRSIGIGAASRHAERRTAALRSLADGGARADTVAAVAAAFDDEGRAWADELRSAQATMAPVRETRPVRAAAVVGLSTLLGSTVPLLPFVLLPMSVAPFAALAGAVIVLFIAGVERARVSGGRPLRAGLELVAIGVVSAFAGYLIGQVLRAPVA